MKNRHPIQLSIVIPGFDEEQNINHIEKTLFPQINQINDRIEIIFVNDGSKDKTEEKIKSAAKKHKNLKLVNHEKNYGLGAALKTGLKNSSGTYICFLDADLSFDPQDILKMYSMIKQTNADCVIGSCFIKKRDTKNVAQDRLFLSKSINKFYAFLMKSKLTSFTPIFRIYKRQELQKINLESNGFEINTEILVKFIKKRKKIVEMPVELKARKYGKSKLNLSKEIQNHLKLIYKIIFQWQ